MKLPRSFIISLLLFILVVSSVSMVEIGLATSDPNGWYDSEGGKANNDPTVINTDISIEGNGGYLCRLEYPLGTNNTFMWVPTGGGEAYAIRYSIGTITRIFGWLQMFYYGACYNVGNWTLIDNLRMQRVDSDENVKVTTFVEMPSTGKYFKLTYIIENIGMDTITNVKFYEYVEPNANNYDFETTTYDPERNMYYSTNNEGLRKYFGVASPDLTDNRDLGTFWFDVLDRIWADTLNNFDGPYTGDTGFVLEKDIESVDPGEKIVLSVFFIVGDTLFEVQSIYDQVLQRTGATITSYSISSGEFKYGDKVSAQVTVKNTGKEAWTFYVGFSVQDPNGKWWDAPCETVTLNPNEEGTVMLYWTVPSEAPAGSYNARVAVWGGKEDDKLTNLLDYKDQFSVFQVIKPLQIRINYPSKVVQSQAIGFLGRVVDEKGNPVANLDVQVIDGIKKITISRKTDEKGYFYYQTSSANIGSYTVNFTTSYDKKVCRVTIVDYNILYLVACIHTDLKDVKLSDWDHKNIFRKSGLACNYFLEQSKGENNVRGVLFHHYCVCLDKTYAEYGSPKPEWTTSEWNVRQKWERIRDDAITATSLCYGDFSESNYDAIIVVVPFGDLRAFCEGRRIILGCNSSGYHREGLEWYGVWVHELCHALFGLRDLYSIDTPASSGDLGYWDIMGYGVNLNPPAPISSVPRLMLNWIGKNEVSSGQMIPVPTLNELIYGGKVVVCKNPWNELIIEGRIYPDGEQPKDGFFEYLYFSVRSGVNIYEFKDGLYRWRFNESKYEPTLYYNGQSWTDFNPDYKEMVSITLIKRDGNFYVNISRYILRDIVQKYRDILIAYTRTTYVPEWLNIPTSPLSNLGFDIDLKCISKDGKVVGMNYSSGEYEYQIEGALSGGNALGCGDEWIMAPRNVDPIFVLDPTPAIQYCETIGIPIENVSIGVEVRFMYIDAEGILHDYGTTDVEVNLKGTTIIPIPATIDVDPDTLNLQSKGNWITAYIELPECYNVIDINVSSIKINNTVVVEPRPFSIGDYDNDSIPDLMVKFDRNELTGFILSNVDIAELYEKRSICVTLTITGYLNDGTPFQGSSTIRVIMPASKGYKSLNL
ncbi:MAG: hypothetical protein ACTSV7_13540 [Candidatus Baldrarchaeia archaeon]